ncbi:hypothetical protein [Blautia sp. MCC283]|uniref:hypothetical protein n=1 Tax=Blautia sp. MCC283 TaxID=2592640 RepID=UPI001C02E385|nr:hypothetical protein [Blautia sp. MCC283]MBT9841487.1 hypothetical protein [Blautia sp. MCC283]
MPFGALLELYDNWNGETKVNDDNLEMITKGKTLDIFEQRKDLLDRTVVAFGFYDNLFIVRLAD